MIAYIQGAILIPAPTVLCPVLLEGSTGDLVREVWSRRWLEVDSSSGSL